MHKPTKKPSVKPFRNSSPACGRKGNRMNKTLLLSELCRDEGFKDKPYTCSAGKISIGIGRNLEDVGLSRDEILYLYRNDIVGWKQKPSQFSLPSRISPILDRELF